ncbi:MAG: glycosyltransferase family 4 protein, partial [Pseudoclavibacter sp.]
HTWAATDMARVAMRLHRRRVLQPDVVVATAPAVETLVVGKWVARRLGAPLVVEMRDAWPDLVTHVPGTTAAKSVTERAKAIAHHHVTDWQQNAAAVVTTTQRFADVLEGRGVERPAVIRNGTNFERYRALPPRESGRRGLRVLYLGNLGRSQGLEHAVRVAGRMRDAGLDVDVRMVGYGADQRRLRALNESLGSPVDLRDQIPASEVRDHYEWADTLLVSLRPWQPFEWTVPSKLYEALATGRHITAMLGGEAAEIVANVDAGDVVPPGDENALYDLWAYLAAAPEALEIGDAGQRWVDEHAGYDGLATRYLEVFDRAVSNVHRRGASPRGARVDALTDGAKSPLASPVGDRMSARSAL